MKYEKTICLYPSPSVYLTTGGAGFFLFAVPSNSAFLGLIGILVGIVAAKSHYYTKLGQIISELKRMNITS